MPKRYSKATLLKAELVAAWKEIEASERARANLQADLNEARVEVLALDGEIKRAKRIAGADFAMFTPSEKVMPFDARSYLQVSKPHPTISSEWMRDAPTFGRVDNIALDVLFLRMRDRGLLDDGAVHFRATFRDKQIGYALSQEAINAMPVDLLSRHIASHMATEIAKAMKG